MSLKILTNWRLGSKELLKKNWLVIDKKWNISDYDRCKIGNREVVGHGWNGQPHYLDRFDFPFPAIRFRTFTPDLMALREKERGDWRKLTLDEKKWLYRASFCQTFAEMQAPTSEWKYITGWTLMLISIGLWLFLFCRTFIQPKAPISFDREHRIAQYNRAIDLNMQPITGVYRPPGAELRVNKGMLNVK